MPKRLESSMIKPILSLMHEEMGLEVTSKEFSAGYGIADLVGGVFCRKNCLSRNKMGLSVPIDHRSLIEVLLALKPNEGNSITNLLECISYSESTLKKKVLPKLEMYGLVKRESNGYVFLRKKPPKPTKKIIAVEAKQYNWRRATIQARRYTFFAEQTYIAVWTETVKNVDILFLNKHQIGLIGVGQNKAEIIFDAPELKPRNLMMNRYCSEYLYGKAHDKKFCFI